VINTKLFSGAQRFNSTSKTFFVSRRSCKILGLAFFSLLLASCSSPTPKQQQRTSADSTNNVVKQVIATATAESKLAQAKVLAESTISADIQQQVNLLLIEASELYLQENNFPQALFLANKTSNLVSDLTSVYRLLLVKATSLQALNRSKEAYQQLKLIEQLNKESLSNKPIDEALVYTFEYYQTLSEVLFAKALYADSATALLLAFSLNDQATEQDVWYIWQQLNLLTPWQIQQIKRSNPPLLKGWQQLLQYSHKFGATSAKFHRYLSQWQQQYPTHPASVVVESLRQTELPTKPLENIAVLLPLSGTQAKAGIAAQQGILSAYKNNAGINLHFIDTQNLHWQTLENRYTELAIDHVIGPLLKSDVKSYLNISDQNSAFELPTLLLNLPQQYSLQPHQSALSMRPENEAQQAAEVLSQQNYQSPVILSYQDNVSKRIATAFSQQWQIMTGNSVDILYLRQGKEMQASLKESLDVNSSQARVNQLTSRLKQNIKSEARNRRDIDMIYLVGSAAKTRLIKPYIDVNISPFATVIPVYASSRSHSHFTDRTNDSNQSDLQNLTFTQIPWLLNSKQQHKSLAQLSDKLWPKRTDSLSRIFAMGYDSYHLLAKLPAMKKVPYIRHFGQTGTLLLDANNILKRSLIWGRYQQNKVAEIVMD